MMADQCSEELRGLSLGVPCHGGDSVGMTKVHCSPERGVEPKGIHLQD